MGITLKIKILILILSLCLPAMRSQAQGYTVVTGDDGLPIYDDDKIYDGKYDEGAGDQSGENFDKEFEDIEANASLPWPERMQQALQKLTQSSMLETSQLGLLVYDLTDDRALFRYNDRQLMRPASVMKVVTAVTALDCLGGEYSFRTMLYYTGSISGETLNGDLYCVGGFDPAFSTEDMNAFVECIEREGIKTINGRLVADVSMKDSKEYGEGWCWDDDNSVLSPLLINKRDEFLETFRSALNKKGITVNGYLSTGTLPAKATQLCGRYHPMETVLQKMMKKSDNLYAEAMFYQIAASNKRKNATAKDAAAMTRRLINSLGMQGDKYKIADGSGLSLYNYISAELLVQLLRYAYRNNRIYPYLQPSLPIAGEDGTLKSRMKSGYAKGNIEAKTGTVTAVSSLAGYAQAYNGHQLCFAIINNGVLRAGEARAFQDKVCQLICAP